MAALQVSMLLIFVAKYASEPGTGGSGGAEMGLFFLILLPLGVLLLATAVFHYTRWRVLRVLAALVIVGPMAVLAWWGLDTAIHRGGNEAARRDYASGRGYFTNPEAQALAEAIVRGDVAAAAAAARATDVNQAGKLNQTFLGLAMTQTVISDAMVHALLEAGADPNQNKGWPLSVAISRRSAPLATMLLDAGANANQLDALDWPAFFNASDQPDMLALLLRLGLHVDAVDGRGWTALMHGVWHTQWPAVALLLQAGADLGHAAADGSGLEKSIAFVRYRADITGHPIPPELLDLEERLRNRAPTRG